MKRLLVLFGLLLLLSASEAFAQSSRFKYLGGLEVSYLTFNENYSTGSGVQNVTLGGVGVQSNFMTGLPLGFFGSVTLAYAVNGAVAGSPIVMSHYSSRLLFNMLFGVGYRVRLTRKASLLVGAGGNAAAATMLAANNANSLDLAYAGGFGALVEAEYSLTRRLGVVVTATGAYDPFAIVNAANQGFKNGFEYSIGGGINFLY